MKEKLEYMLEEYNLFRKLNKNKPNKEVFESFVKEYAPTFWYFIVAFADEYRYLLTK